MNGVELDPNVARVGPIYSGIMGVVSDRLDSIAESLAEVGANPNHPNNWRNADFCYLQIRKCVEYVALALLAAHRANDYECEKLENAYKADVIFHDLEKLNPHGFPKSFKIDADDPEPGQHHVSQAPTLSKRRMKRIYDDCAVHLHSGRLGDIINNTVPPYDLIRVAEWQRELVSMLGQHHVILPHVGLVMLVWMKDPVSGAPKVVFCKADGAFRIDGDAAVYNDTADV